MRPGQGGAGTRGIAQGGKFDRRPAGDRRPNGDRNRFDQNRRNNNWNNNGNRYNKWTQNNNFYGGGWGGYGGWGSGAWLGPVAWSGVAGFLGGMAGGAIVGAFNDEPSYVSYGGGGESSSYSGGDTIIVNGESQPAEQYAEQATDIADNYTELAQDVAAPPAPQTPEEAAAPVPEDVQSQIAQDWMPLGLYGITEENSTADPTRFVQLVVSKTGAVNGTLHDLTADTSTPVQGAVDPKSQRVVWKVDNTDTTMETGLYNLTQSETPILEHQGTTKTRQLMMARIEDPALAQAPAATPATP
jgi:hypothetical protein